jgi:glucosamine--fructose-6-phosphate aminotransferase (isomerizing)
MNAKEPGKLYIARHGSPLVTGTSSGKSYVASDVPAILPYTREMTFLEDGDIGVIQEGEITLYSGSGEKIARKAEHIPWSPLMAERGGYKHFMLKEIFEQPNVFEDAIAGRAFVEHGKVQLDALSEICAADSFLYDEIVIIACGTSLYAGMVGKYLIESLAGVRVTVELASEFRYRNPIINKRMLVVPISQSGETADTLAALQMMKKSGVKILSICNVIGSTMTREADATIHTHAGPEIGVASTKAFTTQLTVLLLLALDISGRRKHLKKAELTKMLTELLLVPRQMQKILEQAPSIQKIAEKYAHVNNALFIGRGPSFPVALEGALKLKEISYIHAEGFAAGELKHGPIALIESGVPVIAIALNDEVYEKMLANIEVVKARGAKVIAIVTEGNTAIREKVDHVIELPATSVQLAPILVTIPLQLLAYFVADHKGTDVDQPRNLAKSVTVE